MRIMTAVDAARHGIVSQLAEAGQVLVENREKASRGSVIFMALNRMNS